MMEITEFKPLVHEFLNRRLNAGFENFGTIDHKSLGKFEIQFRDKINNYFSIIIEYNSIIQRAACTAKIQNVLSYINTADSKRPGKLFVVFNSELKVEDKAYFLSVLEDKQDNSIEIFDSNDVLQNNESPIIKKKIYNVDEVRNLLNKNKESRDTKKETIEDNEKSSSTSALREASNELLFDEFQGKFWWINISEDFFSINEDNLGKIYKYPINNENGKRRYLSSFHTYDIAISYQIAPNQRIAGVFQVINTDDSYIHLKFVHELPNKLGWKEINEIPEFLTTEILKTNAIGAAFPLSLNLFKLLVSKGTSYYSLVEDIENNGIGLTIPNANEWKKNPSKIAPLKSDSIDGEDFFKLDPDVTAFAKVIASSSFKPPLAIALFGKWGMGKSFFMNRLMEKIRIYSKSQEKTDKPVYCTGVAHIHFNAWSYMDANLWASIVSKIFEGLNEYIGNDSATANEKAIIRKELSGQLEIIKEQRESIELKKIENETKINGLEDQKQEKERSLEEKLSHLKNKTIEDVIDEVNAKFKITEQLNNAFEEGIDKDLEKSINENIPEHYRQNPDLLLEELKSKRVFISQLLSKKNFWFLILIIVSAVILNWLVPIFILKISPAITNTATLISQALIAILAFVIPIWKGISSTYKKLQPFVSKIWEIKINYDKKVAQAIRDYNDDLEATEKDIYQIRKEIEIMDELIFEINNENTSLQFKLNHNLSTLALNSFIEKRIISGDYQQHLGIVSTIRKDFQILNDLFLESRSENQLNKPLERIVLYIDDLDRCPEERVIEVLEAVNLLMAFPLFVVVVGVDPRWVNNALLKKYYLQFGKHTNKDYEKISATDYLEKIFQVPFHLKQAEDVDVKNMLKELTKGSELTENFSESDDTEPNEHDTSEMGDGEMGDSEISMGGATRYDEYRITNDTLEIDQFLSLRPDEVELMQDFSEIIGNNPRSIKRFVNIYQIVRAHEGLTTKADIDKKEILAIMFLLGLSIGPYKLLFKEFEQYIDLSKTNMSKFLSSLKKEESKFPELIKELDTKIRKMQNSNDLIRIMTPEFKKHNQFIKRFTFSY